MSPMDHAEHVTGIASLVTIAVVAASAYVSVGTIVDSIAPQWRRILAVLVGAHLSPAASVAPFATARSPQLCGDEAAAEPAIQVRA